MSGLMKNRAIGLYLVRSRIENRADVQETRVRLQSSDVVGARMEEEVGGYDEKLPVGKLFVFEK